MNALPTNRRSKLKSMATILIFGVVMAVGIIVTVAVSAVSINTVRVGGEDYRKIVQVKDLIADILPPPLYIIEAYLEANLAFNQLKPMAESKARIKQLLKDYNERWEYWKTTDVRPDMKEALTETSHAMALKFWHAVLDEMLPAVDANPQGREARVAFEDMTKLYLQHRAVIDKIVESATARATEIEGESARHTRISLWSVSAADGALFLLLIVGIAVIARRLVRPLTVLGGGLHRLSLGDLSAKMTGKFPPEYRQLQENFNTAADKFLEVIGSVKSSAREFTNASGEISSSTTDLSQRTEEQAASLEETSAAMEQISATVRKNAENASNASESAGVTSQVAGRGGAVVTKAIDAMAKIEESSRKIADIISVIDEIARQTNLLALNAAVEAARAGEAGRGFAVVASEVRSLAQRSAQAAKDINGLITSSNAQVTEGVGLVNQAGTVLNEIISSIKVVTETIAEIASASAEQATGLDEVNKALTQMDEATQQNSALVEENAATAKTLENQARSMDEQVDFFRTDRGKPESDDGPDEASRPVASASQARPQKGMSKAA